mmetsp:Transcript_4916/g.16209  ORF Transcript_4916/g.16209 Transcript_4916/m.16209 type:complete len:83 (-) Transcript_4916:1122-1370(-)
MNPEIEDNRMKGQRPEGTQDCAWCETRTQEERYEARASSQACRREQLDYPTDALLQLSGLSMFLSPSTPPSSVDTGSVDAFR